MCGHVPALLVEEALDGLAKSGVRDPMGGVGRRRHVAARELVIALRAGLDAGELVLDRVVDRLMVADLEMQARVVLDRAPVAAIDAIAADQIERAGDRSGRRAWPTSAGSCRPSLRRAARRSGG